MTLSIARLYPIAIERKDLLRPGYLVRNALPWRLVRAPEFKILNSVVRSIAVFVVWIFMRQQRAAQMLRVYVPVLFGFCAVHRDVSITGLLANVSSAAWGVRGFERVSVPFKAPAMFAAKSLALRPARAASDGARRLASDEPLAVSARVMGRAEAVLGECPAGAGFTSAPTTAEISVCYCSAVVRSAHSTRDHSCCAPVYGARCTRDRAAVEGGRVVATAKPMLWEATLDAARNRTRDIRVEDELSSRISHPPLWIAATDHAMRRHA